MEDTASARVRLIAIREVHYLDLVERIAKSSPPVEVKVDQISTEKDVVLMPDTPDVHYGPIVFHQWEGKYILLMGREKALRAVADGAAVVKGKLVSRQALKRCRIDGDSSAAVEEFRNTPRIIDKRPAVAPAPAVVPAILKPQDAKVFEKAFNESTPLQRNSQGGARPGVSPNYKGNNPRVVDPDRRPPKTPNSGISGSHAPGYPKPGVEPGQTRPNTGYPQVDRIVSETPRRTNSPSPSGTTDNRPPRNRTPMYGRRNSSGGKSVA